MITYEVEYLDSKGTKNKMIHEAENEIQISEFIKSIGGYYISSREHEGRLKNKGSFSVKVASIFCYQLSTMLGAGIGLLDSLDLMQSKATKSYDRLIYRGLFEAVQKGNSLSEAMLSQGNTFDVLLISMVKMGEEGGDLDGALRSMSDYYSKNKKIKDRIRSASIYPAVLLIVSLTVVLILVVFVLPGITANFGSDDLPLATKILMGFSHFILDNWLALIIFLVGGVAALKVIYETPRIKIWVHRQVLYLPIVGKLMRTIISARLARSFASLYLHGISTLEMIELSAVTLGNSYFETRLLEMKLAISYGSGISDALALIPEFDPLLGSMLRVGEKTGSLDEVLINIAEYFDVEADAAITRMIGIIEPVMIITMGITIGFIVISIIQPIFKMYETLG